jgi:LmbE family N-acetylglucosaminyl deacetylase
MDQDKNILYVGGHPDDVFIGCAISIKRNLNNSYVLTVATGVVPNRPFPVRTGGFTFKSAREYSDQRLKEDKEVMESLGLDLEFQYTNLQLPDLQTHLHIRKIVGGIERIVKDNKIQTLVTHEIPQSHPDHEIVCFCAHYVGQRLGLEVWEYPMYGFDDSGEEVNRVFLSKENHDKIFSVKFTQQEQELRNNLIKLYKSQDYLVDQFKGDSEIFGKISRDFNAKIPTMEYLPFFYKNFVEVPSPDQIRSAIAGFLQEESK